MTQGNVRQMFIRAYPGEVIPGKKGFWYRCNHCGRPCVRNAGRRTPDYLKMEVDHIVPWSKGGSDELYNLQPLCKPCNREKSNKLVGIDAWRGWWNTICNPSDVIGNRMRASFRNNKFLSLLGLNKRK